MADIERHIAHEYTWYARSVDFDYCYVGDDIVPFKSFAQIDHKIKASPNVKAQGTPVYRVGDLHQGVQADAGAHIVAGTSLGSGCVKFLTGQNNVKANGIPVVRHDSECMVNCNAAGKGGAKGQVITVEKVPPTFVEWASKWSEKLHVQQGAVKNAYDIAIQGMSDPSNAWYERAIYGLGATATMPLAGLEELARGALNIPSSALGAFPLASEGGELVGMASDSTLAGDERIAAGLGAVKDFSFAFLGLAGLAMAVKAPVETVGGKAKPGVFVRPKRIKLRDLKAEEANKGFGKPPYKEGSNISEYKLTEDEKFVRLYDGENSGAVGQWVVPESEIKGLTPEQIQDKFALPQMPTQITDVNVPAGTTVRVGEAGTISEWGNGGGIQVQLVDRIPIENYSNPRSFP